MELLENIEELKLVVEDLFQQNVLLQSQLTTTQEQLEDVTKENDQFRQEIEELSKEKETLLVAFQFHEPTDHNLCVGSERANEKSYQ